MTTKSEELIGKGTERLYPIGIAAELVDVHPRTLRVYEAAGLITPRRRRGRRYSNDEDLQWIQCIRHLIHDDKISVEGIRRFLPFQPCWETRGGGRGDRGRCRGRRGHSGPPDGRPFGAQKGGEDNAER